jgi:hypothetical protein
MDILLQRPMSHVQIVAAHFFAGIFIFTKKVKSVLTCNMFCKFAILDDDTGNTSKWKESLLARTMTRRSASLMQLVYEKSSTMLDGVLSEENNDIEANSSDEEFFVPKGQNKVQVCFLHGLCV